MTTLELDTVTIARGGRTVVRQLSLAIPAGKVTALLGANGAGKSTLVGAIAGLLPLQSGAIRVAGNVISGLPPHRVRAAGVATVPEGHRVFTGLTVGESLRVAGSRLPTRRLAGGIEDALALFPELADCRDQEANSLSGGQQQMLAIASALVTTPDYLLVDELSLGLAPVIVRRLVPVISRIAERGVGVLLVEQFASVALELASQVAVMERGRIGFTGDAQELLAAPDVLHSAYLGGQSAEPRDDQRDRTHPVGPRRAASPHVRSLS
jgi:branched-chain amino acid transport system ATP-binding protein